MKLKTSRIRKNDQVMVTTGKDRGKTGKVLTVDRQRGRVVVEKINMIKRHQKQSKGKGGGIVEKEAAIAISNVMMMNETLGRPVRVRVKASAEGKKIRICAKSGEPLDQEKKK